MSKTEKKKKGTLKTVIGAAAIFAVAVLIIYVMMGGGSSIKRLWREVSGDTTSEYYYDGAAGGSFAAIKGGFAVLSSSQLSVYDVAGEETVSLLLSYANPILSSDGGYAAAWDLGGYNVVLVNEGGLCTRLTTEEAIISVSVNDRGYLCVCTDEAGYGGSVTVYNSSGTALYKWYSGSGYVLSARLKDKQDLIILTISDSGSNIIYTKITEEQERCRYTTEDIIIDADFSDSGIFAISPTRLIYLNKNLEEKGSFDFSEKHLDAYILEENYALITMADYQLGGERTIVTVNTSCDELGSLTVAGDIVSVAGAEKHIAVMTSGEISVYDMRLQPEWQRECQSGADSILVRRDGSVIAAGTYSAVIYSENDLSET